MHKALELLKALTLRFPPRENCNHAMFFARDKDGLRVTLSHTEKLWFSFDLDATDLDLPVPELVSQIETLLEKM